MSLISCPECAKEISSNAPTCPNCGVLIAKESVATKSNLVTTQATAKKFKLHGLIAFALIVVGMIMVFTGMENDSGPGTGALLIVIGLGWFIVNRIRIWWHHK